MREKECLFAFFIFLFSNSFAALPDDDSLDGADSSGGGVAVVCKNKDDSIKSVEMLDLYEGRIVYSLDIRAQGKDFQENIEVVSDKLDLIFKGLKLKKNPSALILKVQKDIKFIPGDVSIAPVNDANFIIIPNDCDLTQIAYYKNNSILLVNAHLWSKMDDLNKAALIVHEAIYLHERELGDKKSQYSRKIVAHLFSDYPFESLIGGIPQDSNECLAHHKDDAGDIAFKFYKFIDPKNASAEILQFTKFRGKYPYSVTQVSTPLWPWPKEDGDLYLDASAPIELYDQLYLRQRASATGNEYYFDEVNGDYLIKCGKAASTQVRPAVLNISHGSIFDFGFKSVGSKSHHTFTITNTGVSMAIQIAALEFIAPFAFLGGVYPGTGGTCATSLSPTSSCTLVVAFQPTGSGSYKDNLVLNYHDGNSIQKAKIDIQATSGNPALLTISNAPTYNYGTIAVGGTLEHSFTITNTSGSSATRVSGSGLALPFVFKGGSYPGSGGTCGATIIAGSTCTVVVQFSPQSVGSYNDSLVMNYHDGAHSQSSFRGLSGTAAVPAVITISGSDPYDFGITTVGDVKNRLFTLTNTGGVSASALNIVALAAPFSNGHFPGAGGTCSRVLVAASSCTINIVFSPKSGSGIYSDSIDLIYNNGVTQASASRVVQGLVGQLAVIRMSTQRR